MSEKLSCSNGANSRVCFYFHTHLFTYTHTHTHTLLWPRRDKIEKSAELVSCLELTTSVRLRLPPALLQHSADVIWGAELVASCLSLSLSLHFHHAIFTVNARGSRRKKDEYWAALNRQLEWALHVFVLKATRSFICIIWALCVSKN